MGATLKYNFTEILAFHVFISEYKRFPQWELNIDPSEPGIFMENVLVRAVFLCFYLLQSCQVFQLWLILLEMFVQHAHPPILDFMNSLRVGFVLAHFSTTSL